jgi:Ribosome-binding factor A
MSITVPEVRMTPDLRLATIYVMPLAGRDAGEGLQRSSATSVSCAASSPTAST